MSTSFSMRSFHCVHCASQGERRVRVCARQRTLLCSLGCLSRCLLQGFLLAAAHLVIREEDWTALVGGRWPHLVGLAAHAWWRSKEKSRQGSLLLSKGLLRALEVVTAVTAVSWELRKRAVGRWQLAMGADAGLQPTRRDEGGGAFN